MAGRGGDVLCERADETDLERQRERRGTDGGIAGRAAWRLRRPCDMDGGSICELRHTMTMSSSSDHPPVVINDKILTIPATVESDDRGPHPRHDVGRRPEGARDAWVCLSEVC